MIVHGKLRGCSDEECLELFQGKERRPLSSVFMLVVTEALTKGSARSC